MPAYDHADWDLRLHALHNACRDDPRHALMSVRKVYDLRGRSRHDLCERVLEHLLLDGLPLVVASVDDARRLAGFVLVVRENQPQRLGA